jgi:hypothetical protein
MKQKTSLSLTEQQCLEALESKKIKRGSYTMLESQIKKLKPKDYFFSKKCLNVLKENISKKKNLKEDIYKVFELKENVNRLLIESGVKAKAKDKKNIKNISIFTSGEGARDLETVFVKFEIPITPPGDNPAAVGREIARISRKNQQLGNRILELAGEHPAFIGTGIYEASLRATPVPPGEEVKAKNEISLDTTFEVDSEKSGYENNKTFEEYAKIIAGFLNNIDSDIHNILEIDNYDEGNVTETPEDEIDRIEKADKEYAKSEEEFGVDDDEVEKRINKNFKKKSDNLSDLDKFAESIIKENVANI